uniref:uncharacterized protein LOC112431572 n=1 Tax=Maylandia zebra TaxID=106582 RepID=UPI000D311467|nr:uncharacterized protein LOC112431572 [Maylandia zebra]
MSNPQNYQPAQALAQMMASIAALQQEQAAEHQRHLQDLQALTERQTQVLQNFLAQFGAAANPPPLDGLELSPEDHHHRMEEISMPGEEEPNTTQPQKESVNTSGQDLPSISEKGKRNSDHFQGESSQWQPPPKRQYNCAAGSQSEKEILFEVKEIMRHVSEGLHGRDKLKLFLKDKIKDLETEKRHLVGVFGKTGAGKSALINAIINKEGLLPSASVSACTSVMIKVEATNGSKYEAHIEFITKKDWEDEVRSLRQVFEDNHDHDDDDDDNDDDDDDDDDLFDPNGKLSALYGEGWGKNPLSASWRKDILWIFQSF